MGYRGRWPVKAGMAGAGMGWGGGGRHGVGWRGQAWGGVPGAGMGFKWLLGEGAAEVHMLMRWEEVHVMRWDR